MSIILFKNWFHYNRLSNLTVSLLGAVCTQCVDFVQSVMS